MVLVAGKNNPRRGDAAYVRGVLLTLGISVMWSTSPLFYRAIGDTPVMEIVFYRSLFLTIGVAFFVGLKYRSTALVQIRAIGAPGLVAAFTLVASSMFYVAAVDRTTIAVVAFTYGATPFFAAALGLLILHEPVGKGTWLAMGLAAGGITLMVVESFKLGSATGTALGPRLNRRGRGFCHQSALRTQRRPGARDSSVGVTGVNGYRTVCQRFRHPVARPHPVRGARSMYQRIL